MSPVWKPGRDRFEQNFAERMQAPAIQEARRALQASDLRDRDPEAYRQRAFELSVAGYFHDVDNVRDLTPFRVTGRTLSPEPFLTYLETKYGELYKF